MSRILYIAEKKNVAEPLAKALGIENTNKGFFTCSNGDIVTWLYGHVLELIDAKDYDPKYAKWLLEDLPVIPEAFVLRPPLDVVKSGKVVMDNSYRRNQLALVGKLIDEAEEVCIATDPDNEGELLGIEVLEFLKYQGEATRIFPTSLDKKTLLKAVAAKSPASKSRKFYYAALARMHVDWLVGVNVTRALTAYNRDLIDAPLYVGRVQTFVLGELHRNEIERKNFVAKPVYSLQAKCDVNGFDVTLNHQKSDETKALLDAESPLYNPSAAKEHIESIAQKLDGKDGKVTKSEKSRATKAPPLGYKLSDLQIAASKQLGMSAAEVLRICQTIYEAKYLSYPRTDSNYMPEANFEEAGSLVESIYQEMPSLGGRELVDVSTRSKAWNDSKIENHHAIIPVGSALPSGKYPSDHYDLYEMIVKRYLMQFMPHYEADKVNLVVSIVDETFKATGSTPVIQGWKAMESSKVADPDESDGVLLPQIDEGSTISPIRIVNKESKTKKPTPYTEAKLLQTMEFAHKLVSDKDLARNMKERQKGIGTQATLGGILEEISKRGLYKVEKKKFFELTDKGRAIAEVAPVELCSANLTASLEYQFHQIEKLEITYEDVLTS